MLYTIKLVGKSKLCKFKADKKGNITSVGGISKKELEKFLTDFQKSAIISYNNKSINHSKKVGIYYGKENDKKRNVRYGSGFSSVR